MSLRVEMQPTLARSHPRVRDAAGSLALVALASLVLAARLRLLVLSPDGRALSIAVLFVGILVASLLVPVAPGRRRLPPATVLAIGSASLVLAIWASGRPVAVPYNHWVLPLVVLGAVAEEALFRRVAYAALEPAGAAVAIGVTALLFAVIHLPLYGWTVFPVDLGAGLLFGWQRWASGTWTTSAGTHAIANVLAVVLR
jgi:membrane protease YdiL (CAAX protease family)